MRGDRNGQIGKGQKNHFQMLGSDYFVIAGTYIVGNLYYLC